MEETTITITFIVSIGQKKKQELVSGEGASIEKATSDAWEKLFERIKESYLGTGKNKGHQIRDLNSISVGSVDILDFTFKKEK